MMDQTSNPSGSTNSSSALAKFHQVTPELGVHILQTAGKLIQLEQFTVAVEQCPVPKVDIENMRASLGGDDKAKKDGFDLPKIDEVNAKMKLVYKALETTAIQLSNESVNTYTVLNKLGVYANTAKQYITALYQIYQNKGKISSEQITNGIKECISRINTDLKDFQNSLEPALGKLNGYQANINIHIGELKTCMTDLTGAIPSGLGAKFDISKLTEKQATDDLHDSLTTLNNQHAALDDKITHYTMAASAVGTGIVLLAIPELLAGPIGWVALAGEVSGEVVLIKKLKEEQSALALNHLKIEVTQAEQLIIKPYFAMLQYTNFLTKINDSMSGMASIWSSLSVELDTIEKDNTQFQIDLGTIEIPGVPAMGPGADFKILCGDPDAKEPNLKLGLYGQLEEVITKLTGTNSKDKEPVINPTVSEYKNDDWERIYKDPNAPFYIKGIKAIYDDKSSSSK